MPNVEIHGLDIAKAEQIRDKIFNLTNWPDVVVTTVNDVTHDRTRATRPFLRVFDDIKNVDLTAKILSGLQMDIEVVCIRNFISADR